MLRFLKLKFFKVLAIVKFSIIFLLYTVQSKNFEIDPNGYIVFCPCMGKIIMILTYFISAAYLEQKVSISGPKGLKRITIFLPYFIIYWSL
jgi:hypothetical protein